MTYLLKFRIKEIARKFFSSMTLIDIPREPNRDTIRSSSQIIEMYEENGIQHNKLSVQEQQIGNDSDYHLGKFRKSQWSFD